MNTVMQLRKICNHPYLFIDYSHQYFENLPSEAIYKSSGKFELLDRIIPKLLRSGHKILIFSQMTHLLDVLQYFLEYRGIMYLRLDGNTKSEDRGTRIDMFNKKDSIYKVFILSTRAGGLGINLQTADTVIIFDSDWNPQMDLQAQDRAHRIGQKNEVRVLRLITKTQIEEEILEKAAFKKNLDHKVIKAGMFNIVTSENDRRQKLEELLKKEREYDEEEDEIPNDEQVNEFIARNEDEFNLFEEMDKERYESEGRDDRIIEILKAHGRDYEEDTEINNKINYRLLQDYEVPEWVKINQPKKDKNSLKMDEFIQEYGKGMRNKSKQINYKDDFDDNQLDQIFSELGSSDDEEMVEETDKNFQVKISNKKQEKTTQMTGRKRKSEKSVEIGSTTKKSKAKSYSSIDNSNSVNDCEIEMSDHESGSSKNMKIQIELEDKMKRLKKQKSQQKIEESII